MQVSGTGLLAFWGKLGGSASTLVVAGAGTALWGSLTYLAMVGFGDGGSSSGVVATAPEDTFYRMDLPERVLLEGCAQNYGASKCDDQAWVILAADKGKAPAEAMPETLSASLPPELWKTLSAHHALSEESCARNLREDLPAWIAAQAAATTGPHVAVLPAQFSVCQGVAAQTDPAREYRSFWFLDDRRVVASVQCSLPGSYSDPYCQLVAYPQHGAYVASFARLPAGNVERIIADAPEMMAALAFNVPQDMRDRVELDFLDAGFVPDSAAAAAAQELRVSVQ